MAKNVVWILLGALAVIGAGCGGGGSGGVVSCTLTENVGSLGLIQLCEELPPSEAAQARQSCSVSSSTSLGDAGISVKGTYAAGPCSHVNALGACRVSANGVTVTDWYYGSPDSGVSQTSAEIQMLCSLAGATFVAP
jgi:hypothetical protein